MTDNTIQDVKDRLDIATVIGRYVQLKKSGANLKGLCPFHNEKSSSFMVSPSKQIWHCFGCGEGGDVFGFIKRYENVEFREALEMAADMAGIELPKFKAQNGPEKSVLEELTRINEFACSYYEKYLQSLNGAYAREYLKERGIAEETIIRWRIGLAPNSFDQLLTALKKKDVNQPLALQAGVLAESSNGKVFDRFRDRVTFPIFTFNGEVVGFSARVLPGAKEDQAKYINSPETPVYNKSKIIFGLNFAKDAIRQSGQVVVMEGQMDVISAHQAGFKNTVGSSGTAFTEDQLRVLKRLNPVLVLAFDNDSAGHKATLRTAALALGLEMEVRVVDLRSAKDPDELINKSPAMWEKLISGSYPVVEYYLEQARNDYSYGSLEQKQFIIETILPLIKQITGAVEADHYLRKISSEFVITESALKQELSQAVISGYGPTGQFVEPKQPEITKTHVPEVNLWEKEILGGMIVFPEFLEFVQVESLPDQLLSEELLEYFQKAILGEDLSNCEDSLVKEAIFMVESNLENLSNNQLAYMRELKKSFFLFKLAKLKNYLQELTIAIKKAELENNLDFAKQLGARFAQLTKVRFEIETKLREA
ncbi:DNA primase [bacterium]|nr:MAG: DNA primase [bacterium]